MNPPTKPLPTTLNIQHKNHNFTQQAITVQIATQSINFFLSNHQYKQSQESEHENADKKVEVGAEVQGFLIAWLRYRDIVSVARCRNADLYSIVVFVRGEEMDEEQFFDEQQQQDLQQQQKQQQTTLITTLNSQQNTKYSTPQALTGSLTVTLSISLSLQIIPLSQPTSQPKTEPKQNLQSQLSTHTQKQQKLAICQQMYQKIIASIHKSQEIDGKVAVNSGAGIASMLGMSGQGDGQELDGEEWEEQGGRNGDLEGDMDLDMDVQDVQKLEDMVEGKQEQKTQKQQQK